MFGKLCSNMLNVTLPTKPVPPIRKILRPLKISVGDSFVVIIHLSHSAKRKRKSSLHLVRLSPTVILEQVDDGTVVSAEGDVQRRSAVRQSIDIRAARQEFFDYRNLREIRSFSQRVMA